jgi:hypothetical protein
MLSALIVGVRFRLSITLTVVAALSFALPPAVLAMGHGANTMACLSHADDVHHGMAETMHHNEALHAAHKAMAEHQGSGHSPGTHTMTCCGLFCVSAMLVSADETASPPAHNVPHSTLSTPRLLSRAPQLPERPPNTLLSV